MFLGVEPLVKTAKSFLPIKSVKKKHIFVDNGDNAKRLPIQTPCVLRTQWIMTEKFAEVLEMKTSMALTGSQTETDALANMIQNERRSAILAADARNSGDGRLAASIEERNRDYQSSVQDLIERGELVEEGLADTITIRSSILPQLDIDDASIVACVTYDIQDPETGSVLQRGGSAKAYYLGDLRMGEVHEIKFRAVMKSFKEEGAEVSMHLYSSNGDQVALSNSQNLKSLTPEQAKKLREQSQK